MFQPKFDYYIGDLVTTPTHRGVFQISGYQLDYSQHPFNQTEEPTYILYNSVEKDCIEAPQEDIELLYRG
ncbi:hypothetical protein [Tuberibacillus sp. Marseille-P3662]|uniref:hypothetical protein n=1 Tax=Tuberibacillus sp. Marseille-P3662 TaxID=1965358 RepID=UPI000A1C8328|nr:hypothetical protein [Tuberibacillus sp. Marseille-P3662]